jgi:hypothetical protein
MDFAFPSTQGRPWELRGLGQSKKMRPSKKKKIIEKYLYAQFVLQNY